LENKSGIHIIDVTNYMKDKIQKLMDLTNKSEYIGETEDTIGWTHKKYIVEKVERIENENLWKKYSIQRDLMSSRPEQKCYEIIPNIETNSNNWEMDLSHLDSKINESYLFHGTSQFVSEIIKFQGFDERVANLQGYFGGGIYFGQNCSKSDEYCGKKDQINCMMFLSRVLIGDPFISLQVKKGYFSFLLLFFFSLFLFLILFEFYKNNNNNKK